MMTNTRSAILALIASAAWLSIAACQPPAQQAAPDYDAELRPALDRYFEAWNTRDYSVLDMAFTQDYRRVAPDWVASSRDEQIERMRGVHAAYPDFRIVLNEAVFAKDLGFLQWTAAGTATLEDGSSKPIEITGTTMVRYRDGLISEEWVYFDSAEFERQLGVAGMPHAG